MSVPEKTETEKDSPVPELAEPVMLFVNYQASEVNNASWLVFREETSKQKEAAEDIRKTNRSFRATWAAFA